MGDRANVYVHEGDKPGVYLYTHWAGTELPKLVWEVLKTDRAQNRADDGPYLARIIFETMISEDMGSETGYGIWVSPPDGHDRIVDVNCTRNGAIVNFYGYEDEEVDIY